MTDKLDEVREVFRDAERIDPLDDGDIGGDPAPRTPYSGQGADQPPADGETEREKIERAFHQPLNDYGNGQRFAIHFGEDVMWVPRVGWFNWTGQVWEKDPDNLVVRSKAQKVAPLIEAEIDYIKPTPQEEEWLEERYELNGQISAFLQIPSAEITADDKKSLVQAESRVKAINSLLKDRSSIIGRRLTHAKNAGNNGPLGHMLTESQTTLARRYEDLDAGELDVNTQSGVLRFSVVDASEDGGSKTARVDLIDHARDHLHTKIMPVEYDARAVCPQFDTFLNRILPDPIIRAFVQRWLGLSLTSLKVQNMAFFYGTGANGKSVLVDTIARIMGSYSATARIESLTGNTRRGGGDATPDLIPLMGARMVRTSEPEQGERLQEGRIKELTGGEPMQVRALHSDFVEVLPFFKLVMSGNVKPVIHGTDDGIWRRLLMVEFGVSIPYAERDPYLVDKLWTERSGILNWLIDGLIDYLECGLQVPDSVRDNTDEYRMESDPIGSFLAECCEVTGDPDDQISSKDFHRAFNYYRTINALNTLQPTTFARRMADRSKIYVDPESGKTFEKIKSSISKYAGVKLEKEFKSAFDDVPRDSAGNLLVS